MKKTYRITAIMLLIALSVSISAAAASVSDFDDVKPTDWYYNAVDYATSNGLFNGTSVTTFSPDAPMTRGMFVTVLGRMADVPDTYGRTQSTPFNDVTQADYFFPYAVWANDNGIVTGVGDGAFNPHGEITREQIAAILYRYFDKFGFDLAEQEGAYHSFADTNDVSTYAVAAMEWATAYGVINGSNGKLNPQNKANRAQVAQMLLNFSNIGSYAATEPEPAPEEPNNGVDWENYNPTYDIPTGKSAADADGGYFDYDLANEIMAQVNAVRIDNGLEAVLYHPTIQEWSAIRAKEQLSSEGHARPNGSDCLTVGQGLSYENITILRNVSNSEISNISELAARAVNNWYTSSAGHKEAMLSSASNLGAIACYVKGDTVYIVQLFSLRTLYYMDFLI